jgi:hypothetical protein
MGARSARFVGDFMFKALMAVAASGALLAAPVQAGCWRADEASAASVRELQSMLMVAALRCQVSGFPMMNDYNAFVQSNRGAIGAINERIKAHFIRALGPVGGQRAYDGFTTAMANGYGSAPSGPEVCGEADNLAREGSMLQGSMDGLMLLAERQGLVAKLPEGLCAGVVPMTIASAGPLNEVVRR